jgi:hypothetical protein
MAAPNTSLAALQAQMCMLDAQRAAARAAAQSIDSVTKNASAAAARAGNEAVFNQSIAHGKMWVLTGFEKLKGKVCGSGQCPAIAQAYGGLPMTREWFEGPKVKGNPMIPYGTAVATFVHGRYPNLPHGNHVAIYIDQDAVKGVLVFDQWTNRLAGYRWMKFGDGITDRSNDGAALSVILTPKTA